MGLGDWLRRQLIDIVDWPDADDRTLVWTWPRRDNQIAHGAKLIVRPGQAAVLLYGGRIADVFLAGTHSLDTDNLPRLRGLAGWTRGFTAPFVCEVLFVNTRQFLDRKWGTLTPIVMRDPDFGMVRVRAYGAYAVQVLPEDVVIFVREVVGADRLLETAAIEGHLRAELVAAFTHALGEADVPVLDLAADTARVAAVCQQRMNARFNDLGLSLTRFVVQSVSVPEAVEQALDQRARARVLGEPAEAVEETQPQAAPAESFEARLRTLKRLHDSGLIDDAAYAARRDQILAEI